MSSLLTERFAFSGGRVERPAGRNPVIRSVLLCGPTSKNQRRYRREAFAGDRVKMYADKPVYLNHTEGRSERRYEDQIGWVRNPRHRADGMPVGDIEVKKSHPFAETFLGDAEHNPTAVGMSHVARAEFRAAHDGYDEIHTLSEVESVDVVLRPATTKGLFEHSHGRKPMRLRAFLNEMATAPSPRTARLGHRLGRLVEDAAPAALAEPMASDAAPDGAHGPAIDNAVATAGCALWKSFVAGSLTLEQVIGKLKKLGAAHGKMQDDPDADDDTSDDWDDGDDTAHESVRPPTDGKAFAEWLAAPERLGVPYKLLSEERHGPAARADDEPVSRPPTDPKAFAAWLRY